MAKRKKGGSITNGYLKAMIMAMHPKYQTMKDAWGANYDVQKKLNADGGLKLDPPTVDYVDPKTGVKKTITLKCVAAGNEQGKPVITCKTPAGLPPNLRSLLTRVEAYGTKTGLFGIDGIRRKKKCRGKKVRSRKSGRCVAPKARKSSRRRRSRR